jgi:cytochrome c-type biogenesis protein CcmH
MMRWLPWCFAFVLGTGFAATPADVALDARLKKLDEELRCLVCQNQSLADSNAPLAQDLRREVRSLADAGKSDAEIKDFLVARYGDFVLYKPPVKSITWLLWFGPFVLLAGGALAWWSVARRRGRRSPAAAAAVDGNAVDAGVERARALLNDPRE